MEMVWCEKCKTVIWAYDHWKPSDLRGTANMWRLKCPSCGGDSCFDGWGAKELTANLSKEIHDISNESVYDGWSAMKAIAKMNKVEWNPSGDNTWRKAE